MGNEGWGSDWKGCVCGREPARRLADVYYAAQRGSSSYRGCAGYNDFRELLENQKDLDAITVCTPDHWHATIAIRAMEKGKHVYGQKPMAHSLYEARRMAEVARRTKVATQVAVANEASDHTRRLCEWIWAGAIGPVREVHNWSTRPFWPQGINRPPGAEPVPEGLDWDLWLGPATSRPFSHLYLPFVWRGWFDFGTGALGDMGQYSFDTIFRVLKLTAPQTGEASSTTVHSETYPLAELIHWEFPARGDMPAVRVHWYDGNLKPPRPDELQGSWQAGEEGEGLLFVGDSGKILCGFEGTDPRWIPETRMAAFQPPPDTLAPSPGHYREWIEAIKGGEPARANFEFEAPVTETVLLGNAAVRSAKKLRWDSGAMSFTNEPLADQLLNPPPRPEWKI